MAESPITLSYPVQTPSDQLFGGQTWTIVGSPATWEGYVPDTAAVTLSAPGTRDPGNQAECQLADGTSAGFTDTTYALTAAQIQAGSLMGA